LYKTTTFFLERLGLNSVTDLPALAPFLPNIDGLDEVIASLTD
jgi:segregation and condensation protein B